MTDIDLLYYVLELTQPWQILQIRDRGLRGQAVRRDRRYIQRVEVP
jgi:hypothetical protein